MKDELEVWKQMEHDLLVYGVYITKGGERVDPKDYYIDYDKEEIIEEKERGKG